MSYINITMSKDVIIHRTHIWQFNMIHTQLTSYSNRVKDTVDWSYRAMIRGRAELGRVGQRRTCLPECPGPQYRVDVVYTADTRSLYFLSNKLHSLSHLPTSLFAYCLTQYFVPAWGVEPSSGIIRLTITCSKKIE